MSPLAYCCQTNEVSCDLSAVTTFIQASSSTASSLFLGLKTSSVAGSSPVLLIFQATTLAMIWRFSGMDAFPKVLNSGRSIFLSQYHGNGFGSVLTVVTPGG